MKNAIILQTCFENICKNYNIIADIEISEPMMDRTRHGVFTIFVDVHTLSSINFGNEEIEHALKIGVKSNKDYRKLRSMIRIKLIDAIRSLRSLTEESLHNLGVKI